MKVTAVEAPPPGDGFETAMVPVPAVFRSAALSTAESDVELT